ncbi:3-hydroxyacyl-CoA dehydrogenase family protein [Nitrososphaera sp.]|uniref:3-hydroxyacyl-CoA dehydrogenase family protein n=1 Tax=Nitrososphaera sp. TaxID=1971748 RepID=UPI0017C0B787|nr:3-hydroxyacyl-CoA dehydrogenase family protein [Nitrososphaera sp.]NWG36992.1 3-hydroxyacyl-CoA dehydrogenase family protein [Nitrososphaera sp.]
MAINKITVLGSGVMGHGIAQVSAMAGYSVILRDIEQSFLDKAMEKIKWSLSKMVEKQKLSQADADKIFARITPIVDLKTALKDADLLIEAVPEDMNLKKKVYAEIDSLAEQKTLYASNTSTLPITDMAALTSRPDRFIGLHFFNPPQLMPLVEVIPGNKTNNDMVVMAMDYCKKVGKQPVLCQKDVPGFIVNRVFIPLVHEAAHCMDRDGAKMTQIDSAVKFRLSFPMGIFELADYTGLDVIHKATVEMHMRDTKVINPHPAIKKLFEEKSLGQKTGKGFYEYKGDKYERINLTEQEAATYDPVKILAVAANNAAWLITKGVCNREDLEKALKLGMGLKKELFATVNEFGAKKVVDTLRQLAAKYGQFYEPDPYLVNYRG